MHGWGSMAGDSGRGSALMCAQVIKLRLTTCCEARKRRAQRLSCVCTIKKQEEMRKWLAHRTIQYADQR